METNGIEPSTSCLQSTLSIVPNMLGRAGGYPSVSERSLTIGWSARAQASGMGSFIRARIGQHSPARRRTSAADGYVRGYVESGL